MMFALKSWIDFGKYFGISLCLLLGILVAQSTRLNTLQGHSMKNEESNERLLKTQLDILQKLPGLGFDNLLADWTYLQFLQYFGNDKVRMDKGYGLSPDYFEVIIPRDPYYSYFYLFLSGSSSLYAGQPDRTVALMNEGLSHMTPEVPEQGYLVWRYKGTDELLFLGDTAAAQASFQTAADWARQSDDPEAETVAAISQRTADFLAANPVSKRAQVDAWGSVLVNSLNEGSRNLAIERIEALGGRVVITDDGQVQIGYPQED
jgi:hypothetical protein